jgi:hypothetical protein
VLVYVHKLIFGSNNALLVQRFSSAMQSKLEMSMIGELPFILGLQITQSFEEIFLSQEKYLREMLKRFQMEDFTPMSTPMVIGCKLSKGDDSPNVD